MCEFFARPQSRIKQTADFNRFSVKDSSFPAHSASGGWAGNSTSVKPNWRKSLMRRG